MFSASKILIAVLAAAASANAASMAICGAHYHFLMTESTAQTPCDLAELLNSGGGESLLSSQGIKNLICFRQLFPPTLRSPTSSRAAWRRAYPPPKYKDSNDLNCNPIMYQLVAACGACQTSTSKWVSWADWTRHCSAITGVGHIDSIMPYDTPLPGWAFVHPLSTNGTFSLTAAHAIAQSEIPDTLFNVKPAEESTSSNTAASTGQTTCSSNNNVGAAVGGSIRDLALGLLLGALTMAAARRKKSSKASNASIHSTETQDIIACEKAVVSIRT